jgi:hypothetical protein
VVSRQDRWTRYKVCTSTTLFISIIIDINMILCRGGLLYFMDKLGSSQQHS